MLRLCCKASPQELSTSVGLDDRTPHLLNASCQHLKNTRLSVVFGSELKCDLMSRFHDELGLRSPIWSLTRSAVSIYLQFRHCCHILYSTSTIIFYGIIVAYYRIVLLWMCSTAIANMVFHIWGTVATVGQAFVFARSVNRGSGEPLKYSGRNIYQYYFGGSLV